MPRERRAIILLLGLAVGGQGLRLWLGAPGTAPGQVSLFPQPAGSAPLAHRDSGLALARPLAPGERVDLDQAPPLEIARLPRIGLRLAKVIVSDRNAHGAFGSLEAVDRVPGIGPGLLAAIRDQVRFSATPTGVSTGPTLTAGTRYPELGTRSSVPILNLNTATAADLEVLPRVGPGLAGRIVAFRQKYGPFPAVDSLIRVPGIGQATLARLRDKLRVD